MTPHARLSTPRALTSAQGWVEPVATALLVLADGTVIEGQAIGAEGQAEGEVCFNTAMTGYEEILTDPSYAGQIVTFTFPHIGNVGTNAEDIETVDMAKADRARGVIVHADITMPSNWRAAEHFDAWLKARNMPGIAGVDTRALTALIRERGMMNAVIATSADGKFDRVRFNEALRASGYSEAGFISEQRALDLRQHIIQGLSGVATPPSLITDAMSRFTTEERSISYVVISKNQVGESATPDDATLAKFYEEKETLPQKVKQLNELNKKMKNDKTLDIKDRANLRGEIKRLQFDINNSKDDSKILEYMSQVGDYVVNYYELTCGVYYNVDDEQQNNKKIY